MSRWDNFKASRFGRFLRRYWWAYPAFLVLKWGTLAALGYTAISATQEGPVNETPPTASPDPPLNLKAGDALPEIRLAAWEPGQATPAEFDSAALRGKQAFVLYFYPMDDTPGCTKEACGLRDSIAELKDAGLRVVGASADSWESHRDFAAKFELPFTLLVDQDGALRQRLGNPDGSEPLIARITYIVDAGGMVRAVGGGEGFTVDDHLALIAEWAAKLKDEAGASGPP